MLHLRGRLDAGRGRVSLERFLHRDAVHLQRASQRLVEGDARVREVGHGLDLGTLGICQVTLVLHHLEGRGGAEFELLLIGFQGLIREHSRLQRRFMARPRLLHADHRILHIDADLVDGLLQREFVLADLNQAGRVVRLGGPIPQRDIQREAGGIVGIVAPKDLAEEVAVTAGK